jgi:type VI secretion system protein ImpH
MDTKPGHTSESVTTAESPKQRFAPETGLADRGVFRRLLEEGHRFQFSQAIRLLELLFPEAPPPGRATAPSEMPIRLRPSSDLVFPPTDLKRVDRAPDDRGEVHVVATFLGLYGIDSPLPYHFYDHLAEEEQEGAAHRDFLDIFNHRLYAFFYCAWKKYRPALHYRGGGHDRHARRFVSLAGLGTPHATDDVEVRPMRLAAQAGVLAAYVRNAAGLERLLEAFFDEMAVEVVENVPRWVPVPSRSGLGDGDFRLGEQATVGEEVYDRSGKFRLRLGPMPLDQYRALLPGGEDVSKLQTLVRLYGPDHLAYDVELRVRSEDLPTTQLGESGAQLGYTTSAGQPRDPEVQRIIDYSQTGPEASARS